jgi:hypothetical protein
MEKITLGSRERNRLISQGSLMIDGVKYISLDDNAKSITPDVDDEGLDASGETFYFQSIKNGKYIYTTDAPKQKSIRPNNQQKPKQRLSNTSDWNLSDDDLAEKINLKYFLGEISSPAEDFESWFKENESMLLSKYPDAYERFVYKRNNTKYSSGGVGVDDYKLSYESKDAMDSFFNVNDVGFVKDLLEENE